MTPCNYRAPNGEPSLLYTDLANQLGPKKAEQLWYEAKSEQFKNRFIRPFPGDTVEYNGVHYTVKNSEMTGSQFVSQQFAEGDMIFREDGEAGEYDRHILDQEFFYDLDPVGGEATVVLGNIHPIFGIPLTALQQQGFSIIESKHIRVDKNGEPQASWVIDVLINASIKDSNSTSKPPVIEITAERFTKDINSEGQMTDRIKQVYETASKNPDKIYQVPFKRNTPGIKQAGGPRLTMTRLSELFLQFPIPENVKFDPTFEGLMSVTPTRILNDIIITPPTLIPVDEKILQESKDVSFLKTRDEYGNPTGGYFSYEKQQEAIDSITYLIYTRFMNGMTKVSDIQNAVEQVLKAGLTRHLDIARGKKFKGFEDVTKVMAEQRAKDLQEILNVFNIKGDSNNLWKFTTDRLKMYGLNIYGYQSTEDPTQPNSQNLIDYNDGEMLRSYRDSSFELDKKDTASSRIKLFLSAIEDSDDRKIVRLSFTSALTREDVLSGKKNTTIRSAEVAESIGLKKGETAITRIDGRPVKVTSLGPITETQLEVFADTASEEGIDLKVGMIAYSLSPVKDESQLAVKKNYLGMPKLINYEDAFQKLMALLANEEPSLQNFMTLMSQSSDPVIRRVAEKLDRESLEVKNEFVSVMSNQYQQFTVVMFGKKLTSSGVTHIQSRSFLANYSSQVNVMLRNWEQSQKLAPIADKDDFGNTTINRDLAIEFATRLIAINDSGTYDTAGMQLFQDLLKANGIELSPEYYQAFAKNILNYTKGTRMQGTFERQFQFNKDGTPAGIISTLIGRLSGAFTSESDEEVENSFQVNNPMYTEGTAMNILARSAMQFVPMVYSNSHKSSEGKSIYDHGLNTSLSHKVRRILTDENYRKQKGQTYINEHNSLLKAINNDPELRDRFQVTYMDGLKPEYLKGTSGTSRSDMSYREQLLYSFALFEKRGSAKYADYLSLTHSDKTTSPVFLNGPRIKLVTTLKMTEGPNGAMQTAVISDETYKALYAIFEDEYNRVIKTADVSYNSDQFDKGKKFFFTMPEFNITNMQNMVNKGELTQEEFNALWTDLGAIKPIQTPQARKLLLKMFNRRIEILSNRTLQTWTREGLLTKELVPFSIKYMNRLMAGIGMMTVETSPGVFAYNTRDGQFVSDTEAIQLAGTLAARDYAINHFIFNVNSSRLFYGDPAEVFKKDVSTTLVDYAKRLAKDIAPGKDGEWSHSPSYTSVTIEDWEGPIGEVAEMISAYGDEVNVTDAQEFITVQEYLDDKLAVGQISKQVHTEMSQVIKDAKGGYYEFTKPEHKLAMVPQKPVYVGEGELHNGVILTHYVKSSAYPLLPQFTSGKQLDHLRRAMEKHGVARVPFKSAEKLGRPAVKVKLFNKDGSMNTAVLDSSAFTGIDENGNTVPSARQVLSRKGFRIQQEIPHDPDKRKIGIVTQMNTLIVQGISTINTPFIYQGQEVTAQALMDAKTQIRQKMFDLKSAEILEELGVKDGEVKNHEKLYDTLLEEAGNRPGYTLNDIELLRYRDKEGKPLMPMIFSPSRARFESLLMNKIGSMTEMKMYGHSFVQATSAGLTKMKTELTPEEKSHAVFVGDYRGGVLKTLRMEDGILKPAQIMIPFSFFGANGKKLSMQQFITTTEDGHQIIDLSKLPPEFLQMVGARIPNQGHSSMLPMEVVGFLPDEMADTIIVPAAITKQMGSDFDIDKLYTYQRPYKFQEGTVSGPQDYEDQLLNAYFDIHWAVLMNPEMMPRILSPLDKPDLKMEADRVPLPADTDYFDVIEQLQSFQSQKFAKQLVGFTALTLTNNTVFEPLTILLGQQISNQETQETETKPYSLSMVDPNGVVHSLDRLSGYGESTNYDLEGEPKRTKSDNIVVILSGFLDHAKEPVTPQINLNLYTYNAAAALLRLQSENNVAVGIPELAALLRQPVLLEYSKMMSQANDSLSADFNPDLHGSVIEELGIKYARLAGGPSSGPAEISLTDLRDDWTPKEGQAYHMRQARILHLFDILWKMGRQLADVQSAFSWDVAGAGPSVLTALSKDTAISDTQQANPMPDGVVIQNLDSMVDTEKGYIRGNLLDHINTIGLEVFPYNKLEPIMEAFKNTTGTNFISPKVQQLLIEGYLAYQWMTAPVWDGGARVQEDRIRLMYTGTHGQSLAKRVQTAKRTWGRNNYLLQRLEGNLATSGQGPDFVTYSLGISSGFDSAEIARSWTNILTSEDSNQKQLGEDLVRYAILTGNSSSLARHIPISYILGTSLLQATTAITEPTNEDTQTAISLDFTRQFLQHYPQYTKQLSADLKETGTIYEEYPETFKVLPIDLDSQETHPGKPLWIIRDKIAQYPDFLSYRDTTTNRWILYQLTGGLTYQRIDTLGNNQIDEYSVGIAKSIIPENKAYTIEASQQTTKQPNRIVELPEKGDWNEMSNYLTNLSNDTKQPILYRNMADLLNKTQSPVEQSVLQAVGRSSGQFKFEFENLPRGIVGFMDSNGFMSLSKDLDPTLLPQVVIHELIHYQTAATVGLIDVEDNQQFYKNKYGDQFESYLKASRLLKANMPDVAEKVKAIDDIRKQALDRLKKESGLTEQQWTDLYNQVTSVMSSKQFEITENLKPIARLIYAFASNAEFISHIFTDADVMKWLNNRKADVEKSFWDKVVDAISAIMESIASFIGVGIDQESLLAEGVKRSMDLFMMERTIPTITQKGIADFNPDMFKNAAIAKTPVSAAAITKINVIKSRLEDQRREIRQTFTGTISAEQAARKRKLLDDLDKEIAELQDQEDLKVIAEVGKKQLSWVNEIMKRKDPTANDIIVADRILELWTNLINVMYGGNKNQAKFDPEWEQITSEAQRYRVQLTSMSIDSIISESKHTLIRRDFEPTELGGTLEDPSWIQVRIRGLSSAAKSKAVQYVSTYMEQVSRTVDEDVLRTLKDTQKLEEDFIKYAGSKSNLKVVYQKLMQENKTGTAWGLVKRYSPAWFGFLMDAKSNREHKIDVINRDKGLSGIQKGALKKAAWQDYWKTISSQAVFVDTRLFFNEKGENHISYDKAYQELLKDVDESQAEAAVEKARERYKKYLEEKKIFTDMMEADVLDGSKTKEEAEKEVTAWQGRYSPNVFFNNFKNGLAVFNENNTDRFVIMLPKKQHTKYFDKKFTDLENDPKLYELYNRLHNTLLKLRSYLPKSIQYELGENFLPVVAKNLVSDISSVPEYIKGMPQRFLNSLTASSWEEGNKGTERIPISYVNTKKEKDPAEIAGRSKDLVKITELFAAMAIHYKHFANAKDVIDMGQSIIREIDRTRTKDGKIVDEQGRVLQAPQGLKNALDALQYMKEYVVFKRAKALEGNTNVKVYDKNPITNAKITAKVKELVIQREKLNEQLLNGDIDGQEWKDKTDTINQELSRYEGRTLYGSKVGDKLISIAQAKALSFNPFSAVANFTFGVVSSAIFANGRQEFGNKEFRQSLRIMMSSSGKWASFGAHVSPQARKIMNVMDRLGVMGDVVESSYGKLDQRERIPKWKKTINPYNWLRSGDYFCRGLNTVATLLKQKVKVTEDGINKEISVWEALDDNGEWNEARFGKRPEYFSENIEDQKEWAKLKDKIARVNMIVMGNVDKASPKMANKWIIGRLLGQFRLSWLPEGWYNRWNEEKYDIQLQRVTKGRFTTYKDLGIGGSLRILMKQFVSVVAKTDPFTGEHRVNGTPINDADIENMRRNFAEINFYLMIVGAVMMLRSLAGMGDDDDESQSMQIAINMILRMKQDVAFYSSPEVFDTVTRNAIPAFGVIKDYTRLMDATWKIMTEDDYTADRWLLKMTKAGLPIPQATLVNKIKYMSERDLDDIAR
jgi:uncharacterized membrane protein